MSTHAANPVEALAAGKRFTLAFKNAAEDVPRLITCYGRCCGGELALVLRPDEGRGAFVKVSKDKALASWAKTGDLSDAPREPDIELSPKDAVKRVKVATSPTTKRNSMRTSSASFAHGLEFPFRTSG